MSTIQFAIEGEGAADAAASLVALPELSGSWEATGADEREITLAAIATVVGITGGTLAAAEQIRKWYAEWQKGKSGKTIKKVVLVGSKGKRIQLENATAREINEVLQELVK
ncbi:MAG: hypothetical protein HS126_16765 [Anaerolineales bacterium]|nr:hypothetical protein [Anaerolineales bacterium]